MASGFEDKAKIEKLPSEGVHCFPASGKQITVRRVISGILFLAFGALAVFGFIKMGSLLPAAIIACVGALITLLVFVQSFLIAKYRVAVDYNEKNVVLRFRFSTIKIPFENFDAREGEPDRAEALVDKNMGGEKAMYLVLDNVFEDACFQTSTRDLASREDFLKLREETFAIADAYGARNSEDKVRFWNESEKDADVDDEDLDAIIEEAKAETESGAAGSGEDDAEGESADAEVAAAVEETSREAAEVEEKPAEESEDAAEAEETEPEDKRDEE